VDLDKINLATFYYGGLFLGLNQFLILPAASKHDTRFKSGQKRLENNQLAIFLKMRDMTLVSGKLYLAA